MIYQLQPCCTFEWQYIQSKQVKSRSNIQTHLWSHVDFKSCIICKWLWGNWEPTALKVLNHLCHSQCKASATCFGAISLYYSWPSPTAWAPHKPNPPHNLLICILIYLELCNYKIILRPETDIPRVKSWSSRHPLPCVVLFNKTCFIKLLNSISCFRALKHKCI